MEVKKKSLNNFENENNSQKKLENNQKDNNEIEIKNELLFDKNKNNSTNNQINNFLGQNMNIININSNNPYNNSQINSFNLYNSYNYNNYSNQFPMNINNYLIQNDLMNYNNLINIKTIELREIRIQFIYLKEKGLKELNNINNSNCFFNSDLNFNKSNINNIYNITYKSKPNDIKINIYQKDYNKKTTSQKEKEKPIKESKKISEKNIININDIISGKETRTVVRIDHIPPKLSTFHISKLFDKYLNIDNKTNKRIYKAIYTPLCKIIGKNIGYCFVMMVKPKYVIQFYNTFNGKSLNKKNNKKPCSVVWADLQGEDFLKVSDDPLRSPIIFKDIINEDEE